MAFALPVPPAAAVVLPVPLLALALLVEPGRPAAGLPPGALALRLGVPWAEPLAEALPPVPHLLPAAPQTPLAVVVLGKGPL